MWISNEKRHDRTFIKFENKAPLYEREIKRNSSKFLNTKTHLVTPNLKGVSKSKRVVYLKIV